MDANIGDLIRPGLFQRLARLSASPGSVAPIDQQIRSGHECGIFTGQEYGGPGDLVRLTQATHWMFGSPDVLGGFEVSKTDS